MFKIKKKINKKFKKIIIINKIFQLKNLILLIKKIIRSKKVILFLKKKILKLFKNKIWTLKIL